MTDISLSLPSDYWKTLKIGKQDLEFIQNYLFETETPLTAKELAVVLVDERIRTEREALLKKRLSGGQIYYPKDHFKPGDKIVFPALDWCPGEVVEVRPGSNPEVGEFNVIEVALEGKGKRFFAADLMEHILNEPTENEDGDDVDPTQILAAFGKDIEKRLAEVLENDEGLVYIAGRWFPKALLIDVNVGHLNLAEAVLDMSGGEPLSASAIVEQIELPGGVNPKLAEFSLNFALQEDPRFDEVGPAGEVVWCLERLEPPEVREIPPKLRYSPIAYEREALDDDMLELEAKLDDELSDTEMPDEIPDELEIILTYPHWRSGSLPVSSRLSTFFPTAYESPRIRFTLVDGVSGEKIPAWVVRKHRYVFGLEEWFKTNDLIPGGLILVRRSDVPGEVVIEARTRRPTREWVRTVLAGSDGGIVFAVLKQLISCEYNERMILAIPDVNTVDLASSQMVKSRISFDKLVANTLRELSKLTPQGHVHAQELYSALNMMRRCPPGPLFSLLANSKTFTHVGDLYFRLTESSS